MNRFLATSPDAQWIAVRTGREVSLFGSGSAAPVGKIELDTDDVDLAMIGPPSVLVAITRSKDGNKIVLYQPPYLEAVARLDLEIPAKLAAISGPRVIVTSPDSMHAMVVRAVGRGLAAQKLEVTGPIEFVVGLERNQILLGLHKKLEVWDAVSGRPLLRPQFQLPPPPRTLGPAQGHLWALRNGSEEVFVYRLSDGRPFRHHVGAPIREVIHHATSPMIALRTDTNIVRLHCFSHTVQQVDGVPPNPAALALLAVGEDVTLLGLDAHGDVPWRITIGGNGAPSVMVPADAIDQPSGASISPTGSLTSPTRTGEPSPAAQATTLLEPANPPRSGGRAWRELLATYGGELARGESTELPVVAIDSELGDLAHRLQLSSSARRTLIALYSLHLVGEPPPSIAKLAAMVNDWPEALGQGDLGQLSMLRTKDGRVRLRRTVTNQIDGLIPRAVRLVGGGPATPRAGIWRVGRDGRTNKEIESTLAQQLGRIAVVEGPLHRALLESRLLGATAITTNVPPDHPRPWPRDAGLVLVLPGTPQSWIADVAALTT